MMLFDEQAQNFIKLRNITRKDKEMSERQGRQIGYKPNRKIRKDKTTMDPYERSGAAASSKTPDPSFDDVQEKGKEYYEQDTLVYYRSELLNDIRARFTQMIVALDKCNRNDTLLDELCVKTLIGQSMLALGAICDVFELDLADIVIDILGE